MKKKNLSVLLVAIAIFFVVIGFVVQVRYQPTVTERPTDTAPLSAAAHGAPSFDVDSLLSHLRNQFVEVDGVLVTHNPQRRAEFTSQGLRYFTKEASGKDSTQVFEYRLVEVRAGGQAYPVSMINPQIADDTRVEYDRGFGLVETYLALDQGVEQVFEFADPLGPGDLVLVGQVRTDLQAKIASSGELRFLSGNRDVLRHGVAIVFDAQGRHVPVIPNLIKDQGNEV